MPKTGVLILCVDGYCLQEDSREVVSRKNPDAFRAREMAWILIFNGELTHRNSYFCDLEDVPPLSEDDKKVQYIHKELHGLPINPRSTEFPVGRRVDTSDKVIEVIGDVIDWAMKRVDGEVMVLHKGAFEGCFVRHYNPYIETINVNHLRCPDISELAATFKTEKGCPMHIYKEKDMSYNCPCVIAELVAHWWLKTTITTRSGRSIDTVSERRRKRSRSPERKRNRSRSRSKSRRPNDNAYTKKT